jgi:drug/metabolite transporter (DMT)-like permease
MINILIAIVTFSLMLMLFKYFERFRVNNLQAIVFNYFTAGILALLSSIYSGLEFEILSILKADYFPAALTIGFLFIITFNLLAYGTQKVGIAVTTVTNKMSMVIPVIIGVYLFNEQLQFSQITGLILAILAIYFSSTKKGKLEFDKKYLLLILFIFFGQGIADGVLNWAQKTSIQSDNTAPFFASIFLIAGLLGSLYMAYDLFKNKVEFQLKNIIWGISLGIPNFLTLHFFIQALQNSALQSAQIFPIVNMGIIVVSSIGGILLFKEKLSISNWSGIGLAILSIALIM